MKTRALAAVCAIFASISVASLPGCTAHGISVTDSRTKPYDDAVGGAPDATDGGTTISGTSGGTNGSGGATGGTTSSGGIDEGVSTGGTTDTGGTSNSCPYPAPSWAAPSIANPAVCAGISSPPVARRWLDDFDGRTFDANVSGWNIAADTTDGNCVVPQSGHAAEAVVSLLAWGSHAASTQHALHLQAYMGCMPNPGANNWGAQWQFQTPPMQTGRTVFDLSSYSGVVVWTRLVGSPGKGNFTIAFMTPQTTPAGMGGDGTCGTGGASALCFGYYNAPLKVGQQCWTPVVVNFDDLQPLGPAPASGFDRAHVFGFQLAVTAWDTAAKANLPADILVDDIYFF